MVVATEQERPLAEELVQPVAECIVARFCRAGRHVPVETEEDAHEAARQAGADLLLCVGEAPLPEPRSRWPARRGFLYSRFAPPTPGRN